MVIMIIVTYVIIKAKCCKNLTSLRTNLKRKNAIRRGPIVQIDKLESSSDATCQIAMNKYELTVTFSAPRKSLNFKFIIIVLCDYIFPSLAVFVINNEPTYNK